MEGEPAEIAEGACMHELTKLIKDDMVPALGVTEPGAIALAVATAKRYATIAAGDVSACAVAHVKLALNSGMYKNAYSCGIPNSPYFGNYYAAALGAVAADPSLGLESLANITVTDNDEADALVKAGVVEVQMVKLTSRIFIQATVELAHDVTRETARGRAQETSRETAHEAASEMPHATTCSCATVTIQDAHTNVASIIVNGREVLDVREGELVLGEAVVLPQPLDDDVRKSETPLVHAYTVAQLLEYVSTVPVEELAFVNDAFPMNLELAHAALVSERTSIARPLVEMNGGQLISEDEHRSALALAASAIEARVLGESLPAMSITGSGSHGILCTLPLYATAAIRGLGNEQLLRATALSFLICMYIKEYSGRLSAFCGCGIAGGTGAACGLVWLGAQQQGLSADELEAAIARCVANMTCGITGMICDGGNHGCAMKAISAVDSVFRCANLALAGASIGGEHGINAETPEEAMRNMGRIASPGMVHTEGEIVAIMSGCS